MQCKYPQSFKDKGNALFPCGQCLSCRINHRRVWAHRIMLEASLWPHNAFLTLTYSDDKLPSNGVSVTEHQSFMRLLRAQWHRATGQTFRFYMCAEYGDKTFRPHYHYALFNFPSCKGSGAVYVNRKYVPCRCEICSFVTRVWNKGHIFIGRLEQESAQYIAGYVTKKMTKSDDPRLSVAVTDPETGEITYAKYHPEFSRASRNPGISAGIVPDLVARFHASGSDELPVALKHNGRSLPLGRYLKTKLKESLGDDSVKTYSQIEAQQMFSMLKSLKNDTILPRAVALGCAGVAMQLVNSQRSLQTEQKFNLKGKKL